MLTAEVLLQRLNYGAAGMEQAKALMQGGKKEQALDAVIEHFRTRTFPVGLFGEEEIDRTYNPGIIAEAEEICRHRILGIDLGETIDWRVNASEHTTKDPEWMWSLARQIFWPPLARAYGMTGDEKYAKEFVSQLKGFITSWPVEEYIHKIGDFGELTEMTYPANAWRTIEAAIRVYAVWLPLMVFFRRSPSFDREAWILFLNALGDHGDFLMAHYSCHSKCSNWDTMESTALFQLGVMLPEFRDGEAWKKTGYRRVMNDVRYQFDHEGIHLERTPIYHLTAAGAFLQVYRLAEKNGIPVPPYMAVILERAAGFIAKLVKPDFTTPMVGDADRNSLLGLRSDTSLYEGMNNTTDPGDENEMRAYFRVMAELTGREDFKFFSTGGREGLPPKELCYALPDAGYFIFRSGWKPDDSFFMVTGTNLERGENSVHSHYDVGHLELQVEGEDVLIDTGRYLYNSVSQFDWRIYFSSTKAHNTVLVDDHTMGEHPDVIPSARGVRIFCHNFEPGGEYDYVRISHNGYAYMEDPVFHMRQVIWLKPDVWVVEDYLTGMGEHDYRLFYNFAPGVLEPAPDRANAYRYHRGSLDMEIIPLENEGLTSQTYCGSKEPIGGWVSYGYATKEPAPQLIYKKHGTVPVRFLTLVAKQGAAGDARLAVNGRDAVLTVRQGNRNWNVALSPEGAKVSRV